MKADFACVWPAEKPPGPYSTSTPFMLLPGTFGSSCWKTSVTLAAFSFGACATALPNGRVARSSEQRMRFMEPSSMDGWESASCLRTPVPFVEADATQARLTQRHERAIVDQAAEVSGLAVAHDL